MHHRFAVPKVLIWLALSAVTLVSAGRSLAYPAAQAGVERIAYISPSRDNSSIRSVEPTGAGDRLVWSVPPGTVRENGIGRLSWRPDATELAFDSSHDYLRSMLVRDLYAVAPDGTRIRRITRPYGPDYAGALPKGDVTLRLINYGSNRRLSVYIEGATAPIQVDASRDFSYELRFTGVADFGAGVEQVVRVLDLTPSGPRPCYFDGVYVDVQPGKTATPPDNRPLELIINNYHCAVAFSPSWRSDGTGLAFLLRGVSPSTVPLNNIWQIEANPPPTGEGRELLDWKQLVSSDRLYLVAYGPPSLAGELLFVENGALDTPVYRAPASDAAQANPIALGRCPRTTCAILGLAWLPDGSGFVFSRDEQGDSFDDQPPPVGSAIYRYTFANNRLVELLRLPNEAIGGVSIAPDGKTIAFERGPRLEETVERVLSGPRVLCPCSVWLADGNGANARKLVDDGRAPAWSPGPVQLPPPVSARAWLPLLQK